MKEHFELTFKHLKRLWNIKTLIWIFIIYLIISILYIFDIKIIDLHWDKATIWTWIWTVLTVLWAVVWVFANIEANKKLAHYHRLQDKWEELINLLWEINNSITIYLAYRESEKKWTKELKTILNKKNEDSLRLEISKMIKEQLKRKEIVVNKCDKLININNIYKIISEKQINEIKELINSKEIKDYDIDKVILLIETITNEVVNKINTTNDL